ncbi:hypothetical protein D3C81_1781840 [compost metagenome]
MELDFDPAMFIAKDFFALRPGDPGGLTDQHGLSGEQRWPVEHVPRDGAEAVAVALAEAVCGLVVVGN